HSSPRRRPKMDCPYHDLLGDYLCCDDARENGRDVLFHALSIRHRRSRLLSRYHPVSYILVSFILARKDGRIANSRQSGLRPYRWTGLRMDNAVACRQIRLGRMAMVILVGGASSYRHGHYGVLVS